VLSLFLGRGYNVAVPVVDVGDDAIVIDDGEHELRRLQVKSASVRGEPAEGVEGEGVETTTEGRVKVGFTLSRRQLRDARGAPLYYMFLAHVCGQWSFVLISREALYERKERASARLKADHDADDKPLTIWITFIAPAEGQAGDAIVWGDSISEYLNRWVDWPELATGRGGQGRLDGPRGRRQTPPGARGRGGDPATSP
jgi:hypothetical protein